jgi:hypothetical protein
MNQHRSTARRRTSIVRLSAVAIALLGLAACGDDGASTASTSPAAPVTPVPDTSPAVPVAPTNPVPPSNPVTPTTNGGGGMQAGAPSFQSFEVSSSVACQDGNAEATMSYTTLNAVDMEIKIGSGSFGETAGYGPNESAVVASIPCSGAGQSTVQMRGCTESHDCADSPVRHVTITG